MALLFDRYSKGTDMGSEISSVTISSSTAAFASPVVAISFWDSSLSLYNLQDHTLVSKLPPTPALVNSLLFASLPETKPQLLVGLGDGSLLLQTLSDEGEYEDGMERRTIGLGSTEVGLCLIGASVFASCDRPAIIHAEHGRLSYSTVNIKVRLLVL